MWRIGFVLLLVSLSGCSSGGRTEPRYLYPPAASCPPVSGPAETGEILPLPVDFRPVTAIRCDFDLVAGLRSPSPRHEYTMYRSDGPLDGLAAALRIPPPTADSGDLVCTLLLESPVFLALSDGSGQTMVPAVPATPCGTRLPEVDEAVRSVTWLEVESR